MGHGLRVDKQLEDRSGTAQVAGIESGDADCSWAKINGESGGETVRSTPTLHTLAALAAQDSGNGELLLRAFDVLGSCAVLLSVMPVMFLVALLIKFSSKGPVLYKQKRVGKDGRIFTLYKFRTMVHNAEQETGPVWAAQEDSRVTRIGRVLRKTRLDEFPQLFNVIHGEMSLVGPRPERPYFVHQHKALQGVRLSVKPGVTGLAQVRKFYNLKPEHKIKYDYLYIQRRSLLLNLYILVKTIPVILAGNGW